MVTAAGAILGSHPLWTLPVLLTWIVVLALSRWIALASVSAALTVLVVALLVPQDIAWAAALALIVVVRHQGNLARRLRPQP